MPVLAVGDDVQEAPGVFHVVGVAGCDGFPGVAGWVGGCLAEGGQEPGFAVGPVVGQGFAGPFDPGGLFATRREVLDLRCAGHDRAAVVSPSSRPQNGYVVSMQPAAWPEPDPQITAAIRAKYGSRKTARPLAVEIRDQLGEWLDDEDFAAAFGIRGRPGWSASRLALVTVLLATRCRTW